MKNILKKAAYLFIASSLSLAACNNGNGSGDNNDTTLGDKIDAAADSMKSAMNNMNNEDAHFVQDASKSNAEEIKWLQAGIDNGSNSELKSDAKKMLADHQDLASKMSDYASRKNITIPTDVSINDLDAAKGRAWDKDWTDKMVDAHQKTIDKFEGAQTMVKDDELKTMISNTLPTLHQHLDMMKSLQSKLK